MYSLPRQVVSDHLCAAGYLRTASPDTAELSQAVRAYQADHGLEPDGWVGPQTRRALLDPLSHFCGVVERMSDADRLCRWPAPRVTWTIAGRLPHVSDLDQKDAFHEAWSYWAAVCGVEPLYTANARTANVRMGAGAIDRAGSTLAWSELPCGAARQLQQKYDTHETWVISANPARHEIDLVRVAAHEIGHVLGIPHLAAGALMQPAYSATIRRPQPPDIHEAVRRYGLPAQQPPLPEPPPSPPAPPAEKQHVVTLDINGRRYAWYATVPGSEEHGTREIFDS